MLRRTALRPKRTYSRDIGPKPLLLSPVRPRGKLDERMQRYLHPRTLLLRDIHVVSVDAAEDGLVGDDNDVLAALELHDDRFETDDDVAVGLTAAVTVVVLVVVAGLEVLGVAVRDFLVGEPVANARIELVERFPFQLVVAVGRSGEEAGGLDGAFEG